MSDWSADVCSSDLRFSCVGRLSSLPDPPARRGSKEIPTMPVPVLVALCYLVGLGIVYPFLPFQALSLGATPLQVSLLLVTDTARSEEHTSELQSLLRISYAVFGLTKKKNIKSQNVNSCI